MWFPERERWEEGATKARWIDLRVPETFPAGGFLNTQSDEISQRHRLLWKHCQWELERGREEAGEAITWTDCVDIIRKFCSWGTDSRRGAVQLDLLKICDSFHSLLRGYLFVVLWDPFPRRGKKRNKSKTRIDPNTVPQTVLEPILVRGFIANDWESTNGSSVRGRGRGEVGVAVQRNFKTDHRAWELWIVAKRVMKPDRGWWDQSLEDFHLLNQVFPNTLCVVTMRQRMEGKERETDLDRGISSLDISPLSTLFEGST
jgi:hypothetical protein